MHDQLHLPLYKLFIKPNPIIFKHHQVSFSLKMRLTLLLGCYTFLSVALVGSDAVTPEVYWKYVLPDTPMPKAIKESLTDGKVSVGRVGHQEVSLGNPFRPYDAPFEDDIKDHPNLDLFFLQKDFYQGTEMTLHFTDNDEKSMLLPREIADSVPFSLTNLLQIYNHFSIKPDSIEAEDMKQILKECENRGSESEEITYCATSLESMIDFTTTNLGQKVKAISTEIINGKESGLSHKYKMEVVKKLSGNDALVCHKQNYAYAVFLCHKSVGTDAYAVSMVGADGVKVNAVAVCHTDTTKWNPKHITFQALNVKPGVPICHFLPEGHVVWVPY